MLSTFNALVYDNLGEGIEDNIVLAIFSAFCVLAS